MEKSEEEQSTTIEVEGKDLSYQFFYLLCSFD